MAPGVGVAHGTVVAGGAAAGGGGAAAGGGGAAGRSWRWMVDGFFSRNECFFRGNFQGFQAVSFQGWGPMGDFPFLRKIQRLHKCMGNFVGFPENKFVDFFSVGVIQRAVFNIDAPNLPYERNNRFGRALFFWYPCHNFVRFPYGVGY